MGFWGKGNNPFFNHDFDAAQRDREAHRASETAHKEKLAHELDSQTQRLDADAALSKLRIQKNAMQAKYEGQLKKYEADNLEMRKAFFKLCLRSNVLTTSLDELFNKHPDMKEPILDIIQSKRDERNTDEYKSKWWDWVRTADIKSDMEYLEFPYEKRETKK
ncbi:hypothetical protein [Leclercia sp. GLN_9]|uniref:hypothetical protein n=1 Tax=Leclercia sp. GLN_9 TaxID=3367184 RepID=UPI00370CDF73